MLTIAERVLSTIDAAKFRGGFVTVCLERMNLSPVISRSDLVPRVRVLARSLLLVGVTFRSQRSFTTLIYKVELLVSSETLLNEE